MILKALCDYYDRMGDELPIYGLEEKEISFVIVIDKDGNFKRIENRMDGNVSQKFMVAKTVGRSSNPVANLLWDNFSYVMDISKETFTIEEEEDSAKRQKLQKEIDKNAKNHKTFVESIKSIRKKLPENQDILAIDKFYEKNEEHLHSLLKEDMEWNAVFKNVKKNVSFLIEGDIEIVAQKRGILNELLKNDDNNKEEISQYCLVTGGKGDITRLFSSTSIIGSQATASIISFQKKMGFDSYGKEQCYNAPISKEAEFKITTALNHLLRRDSRNKFIIGNRTFVFWASSSSDAAKQAEEGIFGLLGFTNNDDDPNKRIQLVVEVFKSIYSGKLANSSNDKFYFLGLAPNVGRIAVVYWSESSLKDFAGKILKHFNDMEIVDTRKERKPYFGLHQMMANVTLGGKPSDVQPNLPDSTIKSIIQGTTYPYALYSSCIRRIRAEQEIYVGRAAIIKAYLNRLNNNEKPIEIMLDKENTNQGYLCGRLFATLERLQEKSNGTSTVRERYMNAASATPAAVFPTLLNLSVHHEEKLDKSLQIFFEKTKTEIIGMLSSEGFPTHLDLNDQGRFMIGYYHQRQDFYKSKKEKENNVEQ